MTLADILNKLKEPVPTHYLSRKDVGKGNKRQELTFISWFHYCDLLDDRCGLGRWQWEIVSTTVSDNRIFLTGRLTIIGDDRTISMDATGTETLDTEFYGDPSSNAESMALRRATAKFGVARYLWQKEEKSNNSTNSNSTAKPSFTPTKPTGKGEITREQWLALRQQKQG